MNAALLIDFGSTYTKATCVDLDAPRVVGTASAFTTVDTDISEGLENALSMLRAQTGAVEFARTLACSSAAGGLRMLACGLVPSLTAEAARLAALGAGAKVLKCYSYRLTNADAREIERVKPDIFLLTGGTDGGNSEAILHNAQTLAGIALDFPVVIAGNRAASEECEEILAKSRHPVTVTANVMPSFGQLDIAPAQAVIRDIFLKRIVSAKGLSRVNALLSDIVMPTPAAVMRALTLLSEEIGDLMAIDLGGATTDVYSLASGAPGSAATVLRGLPEPYAKRTVEGDIGMRYSARGVLEAAGLARLAAVAELPEDKVTALLAALDADKSLLPNAADMEKLDFALASLAMEAGLLRHAGTVKQVYTPVGPVFQQTGKDLTGVDLLILTGGALVHSARYQDMAALAMRANAPESLMPRRARVVLDRQYILSALGLLGEIDKDAAKKLLVNTFGKGADHGA